MRNNLSDDEAGFPKRADLQRSLEIIKSPNKLQGAKNGLKNNPISQPSLSANGNDDLYVDVQIKDLSADRKITLNMPKNTGQRLIKPDFRYKADSKFDKSPFSVERTQFESNGRQKKD